MIYRRSFTAAGFGLALKRSSVINPRAIYRFDYDRKWSALVEPGNNSEATGTDDLDVVDSKTSNIMQFLFPFWNRTQCKQQL